MKPKLVKLTRPLSKAAAARIRKLVDCCGSLQERERLILFPSINPKTGSVFSGLTAELDMLLRGFKPVIKCKEVK